MYTVLLDGKVLYDSRLNGFEIYEPKLSLEVNKTGAFDFKIYEAHPRYYDIQKLKSIIEVYQRGDLLFRGRPLNTNTDFNMGMVVQCEGELAYFNDTIQRPYTYAGGVKEYLQKLIDKHNEQVEEERRFHLGRITVTDPNDYITRADSEYKTTWQIIQEKLINLLGGYIVLRYQDGKRYVDYLVDSEYRSLQEITLGQNMLDLSKEASGADICTALIPTGATLEPEEEGEEGEVVTIESVNNGRDYVHHEEAVKRFGWIYKHVSYSDITLPENLKRRAERELAKMVHFLETIEIKAIDLNLTSEEFHRFKFFEYVKVISEPHDLEDFYLIEKQTLDLNNPENNTITIGSTRKTLTEKNKDIQYDVAEMKYKTDKDLEVIKNQYIKLEHLVTETAEEFRREFQMEMEQYYNDANTIMTEVSNSMSQTIDGFQFDFKNITTIVNDTQDDVNAHFDTFERYIRFVDGTIELGDLESNIKLRILHDKIQFLEDGIEVAFFDNNRLYVTDGEFLESVQLGKFAFFPLENGNLTFRKVE